MVARSFAAAVFALLGMEQVAGHGWITSPSPRQKGKTDCPHCLSSGDVCGGYSNQPTDPVVTWQAGGIVEITVTVTAHHKGHYEVSLCDKTIRSSGSNDQACFDRHILERASAQEAGITNCRANDNRGTCQPIDPRHPERWYLPPGSGAKSYHVKLPAGVSCDACTIQWRWWSANSCIPAPDYYCFKETLEAAGWNSNWGLTNWAVKSCPGGGCNRCGCGEEFRNCVDVRITGGGSAPAPAPSPPSTTVATTTRGVPMTTQQPLFPTTTMPMTTESSECMAVEVYGKTFGATDSKCAKACASVPAGTWPCKAGGPCSAGCYSASSPTPSQTYAPQTTMMTTLSPTPASTPKPRTSQAGCVAAPGQTRIRDRNCEWCTRGWPFWPCNQAGSCVGDACKMTA